MQSSKLGWVPDCLPAQFKPVKTLGRGAYGTVYLCEDEKRGGKQVAVKHVRKAASHGKSMLREIRLLARLRHENLLHLLDFPAVEGPDFEDVFLVLPYLPTDLHKVIQSKQALSEKHVQVILVQILRGLMHLHGTGVAHRDLKPANVLLTADCKLKVCDFGLARGDMLLEENEKACGCLTEYVVTRWYRAPEVMLLPKQYTSSVDLWSVGCILGEILGRKAMFPGTNHIDMVCRVAKVLGTPSDSELEWLPKERDAYAFLRNVCPQTPGIPLGQLYPKASDTCLDLLGSLLRWDPQRRPSAAEALDSGYLRSYQPNSPTPAPEPFDWSFDGFRPTLEAVRERLYWECASYHPEILDRDGLRPEPSRGSRKPPFMPPTRASTPRGAPIPQALSLAQSHDDGPEPAMGRKLSHRSVTPPGGRPLTSTPPRGTPSTAAPSTRSSSKTQALAPVPAPTTGAHRGSRQITPRRDSRIPVADRVLGAIPVRSAA